jgi:two-component system CitB family response regulator/two-component system response regulator DctR
MEETGKENVRKKSPRFLVVEDDSEVRNLVVIFLRRLGFEDVIYEAANGQEALAVFRNNHDIDCIICDWYLPKLSGLAFIKEIRNIRLNESMVVIMVTAEARIGKMEEALLYDIDDYLTKPFTLEQLKNKLDKAFAKIK